MVEHRTYDTLLLLEDGAGAETASFQGSGGILDLGAGEFNADMVVDISAMLISDNDELYQIGWQVSSSATFASSIFEVITFETGAAEVLKGDTDGATGRFVIPVTNRFGETIYRYGRLYVTISGTTPSITMKAYLSKRID